MKKCCFLIPYFGKLPSYFQLFLKSCKMNPEYNWIIFTNDLRKFDIPKNVQIINMNFYQVKEIIQSKFDFEVSLNTPYKLCDYKPAYGYIFEEYIEGFYSWGHCDLDIILGDLNDFINTEILKKYDKIFGLGHMVIYKNTYENNRVFMKKINNTYMYKEAFSTDSIYVFDEVCKSKKSVNDIFLNQKKEIYLKDFSLNISVLPTRFVKTTFDYNEFEFKKEIYRKCIYLWDNGKVNRYYYDKKSDKIKKEEYIYIHLQNRNMKMDNGVLLCDKIKILPNTFKSFEYEEIDKWNYKKIRKSTICFHFIEVHIKRKKKKLKRFINRILEIGKKYIKYIFYKL